MNLLREDDIRVQLRMASVRYVHTQHFTLELLAFLQHFNQLQDVLGRTRAANAGQHIAATASRGSRIRLDVHAAAPIVLIPHSSRSSGVLVLNMGNLDINNSFLFSGQLGTISAKVKDGDKVQGQNKASADSAPQPSPSSSSNEERPSSLYDPMKQSIYGSLDDDLRSEDFASPLETNGIVSRRSLGSFYSSISGAQPTPVSTTIGPSSSKPCSADPVCSSSSESVKEASSPVHGCLVDVMHLELSDMEVYSAEWKSADSPSQIGDLSFPSYLIQRHTGRMLKEKCKLTLQVSFVDR